jgi:purine-binding chemotaxis protein CheW
MSQDENNPQVVLQEPEQAVDSYLASLLSEVEEYHTLSPRPEQVVAEVIDIRPAVKGEVSSVIETPVAADTGAEIRATEAVQAAPIIPDWAQEPFQCLLFKVRGMTLAVPLVALNSIAEWNQDLKEIPGQPDWYMGIILHREDRVVVVDTAQLIMPDRLGKASADRQPGSHILIIGDGRWGLACDSLQRPVTLNRESVRWRTGEGVRPWMAGTVIDKLSVLLDVDALLKMIGHE